MSENNPTRDIGIMRLLSYFKHNPIHQNRLMAEVRNGTSFLSTQERFGLARRYFSSDGAHPHFSFRQIDMCNSTEFAKFLQQKQNEKLTPTAFYISNIADCLNNTYESMRDLSDQEQYIRYKGFKDSLGLLPDRAIVIDAKQGWISLDHYQPDLTQRVHPLAQECQEMVMPKRVPSRFLVLEAIDDDDYDYDAVFSNLHRGIFDLFFKQESFTLLKHAVESFKLNALRAVLDFAKSIGKTQKIINQCDLQGDNILEIAIRMKNLEAVELLIANGAKRLGTTL